MFPERLRLLVRTRFSRSYLGFIILIALALAADVVNASVRNASTIAGTLQGSTTLMVFIAAMASAVLVPFRNLLIVRADVDFLFMVKLRNRDMVPALFLSQYMWADLVIFVLIFSSQLDLFRVGLSPLLVGESLILSTLPVSMGIASYNTPARWRTLSVALLSIWTVATFLSYHQLGAGILNDIVGLSVPVIISGSS